MARRASAVLALAVLLTGCTSPPPQTTTLPGATAPTGDYGDAPDGGPTGYPAPFAGTGSFPTLYQHDGARTRSVTDAVLGRSASAETDANDPADPDGAPNLRPANTDSDDGLVELVMALTAIPPPATLTVVASVPPGGSGGTFYLNVLIDLDMDGTWGGSAEWVARNVEVTLAPGQARNVTTPPFGFSNGLVLPDGAWMRVALTDSKITAPAWTGTGEFARGEIEDHVIRLPDLNGKKGPIPIMQCPDHVDMSGLQEGATATFSCDLTNVGRAGLVQWTFTRVSGFVDVAPTNGANAMAANAALVPPLQFTATKHRPLPSTWEYQAWSDDPPSVVAPDGVTVGFGRSTGTTTFTELG